MTGSIEPGARLWLRLADVQASPDEIGIKAHRLARALRAGVAVWDGFVLPTSVGDTDARQLARELRDRDPSVREWLLRSSSPLEDRVGSTAAGLFESRPGGPDESSLSEAIARVRSSASTNAVRELLKARDVGIAILAQPLIAFEAWATVEWRSTRGFLEGWRDADGPRRRPWVQEVEPPSPLDVPDSRAVQRILDHVLEVHDGPVLLELGWTHGEVSLLQWRPAPATALPGRSTSSGSPPLGPVSVDRGGWGLRVHDGDEQVQWVHDVEHSILPLAPLLAGIFGDWIAREDRPSSSRLVRGYWYDAARDRRPRPPSEADLDAVRTHARQLDACLLDVEARGRDVERTPTAATWTAFVQEWLVFQQLYYSRSFGDLRDWARERQDEGGLQDSLAARRDARWQHLADEIERLDPHLPRSASALRAALAAGDLPRELAAQIAVEESASAHLGGPFYDGFGHYWGEDQRGLYRQLQLRRGRARAPRTATRRGSPASEILCATEDDNDRLARSYWLLRRVLHALAPALHVGSALDLLDLLPEHLLAALEGGGPAELTEARRQGRALYQQWRAQCPMANTPSDRVRGLTASAGRVRARLWVGRSLDELTTSEDSAIAVVPQVTPLDAVHFERIAGLVCEGGDRLGHASILAREHGVPCIVQVGRVSQRLVGTRYALLDADAGELRPLMATDPDTFTEDER